MVFLLQKTHLNEFNEIRVRITIDYRINGKVYSIINGITLAYEQNNTYTADKLER